MKNYYRKFEVPNKWKIITRQFEVQVLIILDAFSHCQHGSLRATCQGSFIILHETSNDHDRHAMTDYRDKNLGVIVGHLPCKISKICHCFTRHEGKLVDK